MEIPVRSFDVRAHQTGDTTLLVRRNDAFEVDEVGAFIWRACDGTNDAAEISRRVAAEYDIDQETATADVAEFLASLRKAGLLE